jgi:U32 family peptidase
MIELLSPVGDFECLKAAVQNGADAVYFGANLFSARAFASNFDDKLLEQAINYAKIRGVKTNLTLNTLIKNNELANAINLAKKAYEFGIDAIIVQDLGLARYLIKNFPGLDVHGSTQMSIHNLEGAKKLQSLGFSRVVLSRELNIEEISDICKNSYIEIEVFIHGALCISYSGQCLFSSMVGGRSGNRGKCAQPCRLPYELLENNISIDKDYLLSTRDLCSLEYLPQFVKAGVSCLKIEGRMKTPEYVATVTRIYRKYLDMALSDTEFIIEEKDLQDLMQVFNRGNFSSGHLDTQPNRKLIYKQKANNMGLFLGKISNFNSNKGHISFTTNSPISIGDKISVENKNGENSLYTVSELMIGNTNIKQALAGTKVKIGRMKGNIFVGNNLYKIVDKNLSSSALSTINTETRKINLNCEIVVKTNIPISLKISDNQGISVNVTSQLVPVKALNTPITKERIIAQLSKTTNTPFQFTTFNINLDDDVYIPSISTLNELRRQALSLYESKLILSFKRNLNSLPNYEPVKTQNTITTKKICLLLNILNSEFDYANLKNIDKIYIPLKYFVLKPYSKIVKSISENFNTYIYMPTIIRNNYTNLINNNLPDILKSNNIKGFVISNIGNFELLKNYHNKYEFICNYTLNVFNDLTIQELDADVITLSPELNILDIQSVTNIKNTELIVYGKIPLMNSNYCLLGHSNKCYSSCKKLCLSSNKYYLKDRLGLLFRVIPDNIETSSTIYNSKITSFSHQNINVNSLRIDILDESIDEINKIILAVKIGDKLEGTNYTSGNINREV